MYMELVKIPKQIQHNRLPLMGEFYCLLNEAIRILELRYVLHKIRSGFWKREQMRLCLWVHLNHCFLCIVKGIISQQ